MDALFIILISLAIVFGVLAYTCTGTGGVDDEHSYRDRLE